MSEKLITAFYDGEKIIHDLNINYREENIYRAITDSNIRKVAGDISGRGLKPHITTLEQQCRRCQRRIFKATSDYDKLTAPPCFKMKVEYSFGSQDQIYKKVRSGYRQFGNCKEHRNIDPPRLIRPI